MNLSLSVKHSLTMPINATAQAGFLAQGLVFIVIDLRRVIGGRWVADVFPEFEFLVLGIQV